MSALKSTGRNLFGPRTGPVYQLEPKLGSESEPVYESEPQIGSKPDFFGSELLGNWRIEFHLQP